MTIMVQLLPCAEGLVLEPTDSGELQAIASPGVNHRKSTFNLITPEANDGVYNRIKLILIGYVTLSWAKLRAFNAHN